MIHYNHNTNKHTNIQLSKPKRHALTNYRHTQARATITDLLTRVAITLAVSITLAAVYLIKTA